VLYRATGNILHVCLAGGPSLVLKPLSATYRLRRVGRRVIPGPPVEPAPADDDGPRTSLLALEGHPRPRLSFSPAECNPYRVFNCLGLGPWHAFTWRRLLAEYAP